VVGAVRISAKKVRNRRDQTALAIEQTRDVRAISGILTATGLTIAGLDWASGCYLIAYLGNEPSGVVGIEPRIDIALIRSLAVVESMRRRGIGGALVQAARTAAHSRGARCLYTIASKDAANYFARLGFAPVDLDAAFDTLAGIFLADFLRSRAEGPRGLVALALDISQDGLILR
jgi:GNAT superfamily N-acetyltransferase